MVETAKYETMASKASEAGFMKTNKQTNKNLEL